MAMKYIINHIKIILNASFEVCHLQVGISAPANLMTLSFFGMKWILHLITLNIISTIISISKQIGKVNVLCINPDEKDIIAINFSYIAINFSFEKMIFAFSKETSCKKSFFCGVIAVYDPWEKKVTWMMHRPPDSTLHLSIPRQEELSYSALAMEPCH